MPKKCYIVTLINASAYFHSITLTDLDMVRSIMTVDDDQLHHKLIEIFIKRSGLLINHYAFQDGLEAYNYLLDSNNKAFLPDIILLDLEMPFSGWSFLDMFIAVAPRLRKDISVIILSSSISPDDRQKAYTYDCVKGFFSKPFNEFLLKDIVNSSFISDKSGRVA